MFMKHQTVVYMALFPTHKYNIFEIEIKENERKLTEISLMKGLEGVCYGTASCLISSYLINHASPILSNELSNTSVWMLWNSSLFNLLHLIIVWSCGHYYKVWQLLGITPHCWLNAKPLLHTAYTQTLFLFSQTIFLHSYFLICSFFHTLSSYLLIFLSLTHLIAGSYLIGGYLDYILLDDKSGLV